MKLFAVHSPAFESFWKVFSESVRTKTTFELVPVDLPAQYDSTWNGGPRAYWEMLRWLVEWRLRLCQTEREVFATGGIDAEFFGDPVPMFRTWIQDRDWLAADDQPQRGHRLCSCLYVLRPNEAMQRLFWALLNDDRYGCGPGREASDDTALLPHRDKVRWMPLPHDMFWSVGKVWTIGDTVPEPPANMLWFHGNFTKGLDHKAALLKAVHDKMLARKK